jgi:excisionase family DNA binding protein
MMTRSHAVDTVPRRASMSRERSTNTTKDSPRWLSIKEACKLLGVDQSTLRRWSDEGKVPVFRTPGGHRRYAEDELLAFVNAGPRRQERHRVSRQALTDRSLSAYQDDYIQGARERRWFQAYSQATLDEHRRLGRRLVDLAIRYAATTQPMSERATLLREGQEIGEHYGRSGAGAGLSVADTIDAFLYFRLPIVQAVMSMIDEEGLPAKRAVRIFAEISQFMEHVLVATVHAHETGFDARPARERAMATARAAVANRR